MKASHHFSVAALWAASVPPTVFSTYMLANADKPLQAIGCVAFAMICGAAGFAHYMHGLDIQYHEARARDAARAAAPTAPPQPPKP